MEESSDLDGHVPDSGESSIGRWTSLALIVSSF
jgi:hypothetical protein